MPYKNPTPEQQDKLRKYRRDWYAKNKDHAKSAVKNRKTDNITWFKELKSKLECNRCDENHPAALDFHHSDPTKKEYSVSGMARSGFSQAKILEEINKCEVLCSNCHRKHHHM